MTGNSTDFERLLESRCGQLDQELDMVIGMVVKLLNGEVSQMQIENYIRWNFPVHAKEIRK